MGVPGFTVGAVPLTFLFYYLKSYRVGLYST